jgi:micrococcal nuclease
MRSLLLSVLIFVVGCDAKLAPPVSSPPVSSPAPPITAPPISSPVETRFTGRVVALSDGDTITVLVGTGQVKIRLDGIDAPEAKQAYGTKAKEHLAAMVFPRTVEVLDKGQDRYGRTIGRVFVNGQDVSESMVREGFAWWYREYAKDDHRLELAEGGARAARLGLWSDPKPIPPWEFRKKKD